MQKPDLSNVAYTLCKHCDHFVDPDPESPCKFVHLEDGEQEFDHDPEPSDQTHTLAQWQVLRPDLFFKHPDEAIGPNSVHHSRRGKVQAMLTFHIHLTGGVAVIQELVNEKIPFEDNEGSAVWTAGDNIEALGFAIHYLNRIENLEDGVKLIIAEE